MKKERIQFIKDNMHNMDVPELLAAISEISKELPGENMKNVRQFSGRASLALSEGFSEDEAIKIGLNI